AEKIVTASVSAIVDERRTELQKLIAPYGDALSRARRAFLDRASFALEGKHDTEFEIKREIAARYNVPFRSVLFAGSAQLGFSPQKDTTFVPGQSDLDVACIDFTLFQNFWEAILRATRAFTDNSSFVAASHQTKLQDGLLRRGMILLDYLPKCSE